MIFLMTEMKHFHHQQLSSNVSTSLNCNPAAMINDCRWVGTLKTTVSASQVTAVVCICYNQKTKTSREVPLGEAKNWRNAERENVCYAVAVCIYHNQNHTEFQYNLNRKRGYLDLKALLGTLCTVKLITVSFNSRKKK